MIKKQTTARQLIADGDEADIVKMSISTGHGDTIGIDDLKGFDELLEEIDKNDAAAIVKEGGFPAAEGIIKAYKNQDNLRLYYHRKNDSIYIYAYGEFQPGRYKLYFEGSWLVK